MKAATFLAMVDGVEALATWYNKMQPAAAKVRQMVVEGREPTPEEWDEMMAEGQDDFDAITSDR